MIRLPDAALSPEDPQSLPLHCSASEGSGTAQFASQLIGDREAVRTHVSRSRKPQDLQSSRTTSEQHVTEHAVLASEIELLPDLEDYLKFASSPRWLAVTLSTPRA